MGEARFDDVRRYALETIRRDIEDDLAGFGVTFDRWYSEESLTVNKRIDAALDVLRESPACEAIANRLVELGDSVPCPSPGFRLDTSKNPFRDPELYDAANYPADLWAKPGDK